MPSIPYRIKSAELLVPGTSPEHISVHTVLTPLSQGQGHIFGMSDITHQDATVRERFLHTIASHLEVLRTDIERDGGNIPRRFESMLVAINADIARIAAEQNILIKTTNILVGVLTPQQVFLSGVGANHALFLHRTAERRYVIYELDAQLVSDENVPEKPLLTVLDGELHPGDVFYIARRIPPNILSFNDLQDILVTLPPQGALERIQQFVPTTAHFGGICFHVSNDTYASTAPRTNSMASISTLEETKSRTADLLGEQAPDVPKKLALGMHMARTAYATFSKSIFWRSILRSGIGLWHALAKTRVHTTSPLTTEPRKRSGHLQQFARVTQTLHTLRHAGITAVNGASRTTKIAGIGAALILVVIVMSVARDRASQAREETGAAYQFALVTIEEKRTAAEAAIIYGNTQEAQILVTDAARLLATLPQETSAQKTKAEDLHRALQALLGKTRGMETVTPVKIAELPQQFTFPIVGMVNSGSALYGITADAAPWRINEVSKMLERIDVGQSPAQNIRIVGSEEENILAIDMDKRLWRTTISAPTITSLTSGVNSITSVEDIFSYNTHLYVLSAVSGQIVKMRAQGLGFEAGTPWITAKTTDLSHARALAIDGSLWVLTDTDIAVFNSGRETPWSHATFDPAIAKPLDIWTSVDSTFLYILDGSDGRVVVMDKAKGNIVAQYVSNLSNVTGFVIRENENRILLTTPTTVYSYTATHLLK